MELLSGHNRFHPKSPKSAWEQPGIPVGCSWRQGSSGGHLRICPSRSLRKIHSGLRWFSSGRENCHGLSEGTGSAAHPTCHRALFHTPTPEIQHHSPSLEFSHSREMKGGSFLSIHWVNIQHFLRKSQGMAVSPCAGVLQPSGRAGSSGSSRCQSSREIYRDKPLPRERGIPGRIPIPLSRMPGVVNWGWGSGKGLGGVSPCHETPTHTGIAASDRGNSAWKRLRASVTPGTLSRLALGTQNPSRVPWPPQPASSEAPGARSRAGLTIWGT